MCIVHTLSKLCVDKELYFYILDFKLLCLEIWIFIWIASVIDQVYLQKSLDFCKRGIFLWTSIKALQRDNLTAHADGQRKHWLCCLGLWSLGFIQLKSAYGAGKFILQLTVLLVRQLSLKPLTNKGKWEKGKRLSSILHLLSIMPGTDSNIEPIFSSM